MHSVVAIIILALTAISAGNPAPKCVPTEKNFYYKHPCEKYANKVKVHYSKITAAQGDPTTPVDKDGGLDLTKPMFIRFYNVTYTGKPIKQHLYDLSISKYVPNSNGQCYWDEIDLADFSKDIDYCQMLTNVDCNYKTRPAFSEAKVNWADMMGDVASALEVGIYYKIDVTERDGSDIINCYYLQAKLVKVPPS